MATILIVDDRPTNRQFLMTLLGYYDHRLLEAADGAEALEAVRAGHPDLIISDILMPTMDGVEFVRQLHADPAIAHIPVIFYTATYRVKEARLLADASGVSYVLAKPSDPETILNTVQTALGVPFPGTSPVSFESASSAPPDVVSDIADKINGYLENLTRLNQQLLLVTNQSLDILKERDRLRQLVDESFEHATRLQSISLKLTALIEFGMDVASEREPSRMLDFLCRASQDILGAKFSAVGILDEEGKSFRYCLTRGISKEIQERMDTLSPFEGLPGRILEERLPHRASDLKGDPRSVGLPAGHPPISSFLGVPIVANEKVYGLFYMADRLDGEAFSDEDERLAITLTAQVATLYAHVVEIQRYVAKLEQEIAERKRAERALNETQDRLRQTLDASPGVIYMLRIEGHAIQPVWVSDNMPRVWGFEVHECMTLDWWSAQVHPDDVSAVWERFSRFIRQDLPQDRLTQEYRFRHRDGAFYWIQDEQQLIRDPDGNPVGISGTWINISERRQLEQQFHQAQKMEAVGQLAGGVAHDFNNLLTIILGYAQLQLMRTDLGDPLKTALLEINQAGERAARLTSQLLAFSRKQILQPRIIDLNTLINENTRMLCRLVEENIKVVAVLDPALGKIKADPGQIEQIFLNLAVNARDAMPDGGSLIFETANVDIDETYLLQHFGVQPGPYVLLTVSDTGCGMDEKTRTHIFEPFFTTKEPGRGTGLGLATIYGIVTGSGGHIAVYSEVGHGATFKIYLPRINESAGDAGAVQVSERLSPGTETILLAEDEDEVRKLILQTLEKMGYTVLEASDGVEALALCDRQTDPIHLLLSDVIMPRMNGPVLADRMAARYPGLKVLFMSGYTDRAITGQGLIGTGRTLLHKPLAPSALVRKVREALDAD